MKQPKSEIKDSRLKKDDLSSFENFFWISQNKNKSQTPKHIINPKNIILRDEKIFDNFTKNILLLRENTNVNNANLFHNIEINKSPKNNNNNFSSKSFSKSNITTYNDEILKLNLLNSSNKICRKKQKSSDFNHLGNKNPFSEKLEINSLLQNNGLVNTFVEENKNPIIFSDLNNQIERKSIEGTDLDKFQNNNESDKQNEDKIKNSLDKSISKQQEESKKDNINIVNEDSIPICRICYDEENEEKGELIKPCLCTGTMRNIHLSCLKTWIENNLVNNKLIAHCEICQINYQMKIDTKYVFSKKKCLNLTKTIIISTFISAFILMLIFIVLYVMVSTLTYITNENKNYFVCILCGIGALILLFIILSNFRNYRTTIFNQIVTNWRINSLTGI